MKKKNILLLAAIPSLATSVIFYLMGNNLVSLVLLFVALMDVFVYVVLGDKLFPPKE